MASKSVLLPSGDRLLLKSSFEVQDKLEAFYAGGQVAFPEDDRHMFCSCGSSLAVVDMATGRTVGRIEEEEDNLTSLAVSGDGKFLMTGWRSLLVRQYKWKEGTCTRQWKAHLAPTVCMDFDPTSTLLATGASNSTVKVWDCYKQYCTHSFKGCGGVVNLVQFHPKALTLVSAAADCKIRVWDLKTSKCTAVLSGHVSAVTGVAFTTTDKRFLISCGRDQVVLLWDLGKAVAVKTVAVFESLEGVSLLPVGVNIPTEDGEVITTSSANICCATAGEKGCVKIWDMHSGKCLHTLPPPVDTLPKQNGRLIGDGNVESMEDEGNPNAFMWLHLRPTLGALVGVTAEHNIVVFCLKSLSVSKQFIGYSDEVLDMRFLGEKEEYLAVATNSALVKVYQREDLSCHLLSGHSAVVLSLDCSSDGRMMVTGSKDNTIRLWQLSENGHFSCVAVGHGHTHSVGAVAFSRTKGSFVVSGAADLTMKLWTLRSLKTVNEGEDPIHLPVKFTKVVHDKDINSIDVSPNDKLVVTGSQDKTAKLWSTTEGAHLGTMRGHSRGVWCVAFSPVDQCVATSSADSTVKLWAVEDCSCVKTFEGHETSVLKVVFTTRGMQLVSSGNDGLVKVWTIRNNECVSTLDGHEDKVWCLACTKDETTLVSGGADSRICFWKDVTEEVQEENRQRQEELIMREQELSNLLDQGQHGEAVGLAISLDHPKRVLTILSSLLEEGQEGEGKFRATITALREDQITVLLQYIKKWNTNAKFCRVAQSALKVLFMTKSPKELTQLPEMKQVIEGLIPYTERHLQRLSRLQQLSTFVEYTWDCMKLPTLDEPVVAMETTRTVKADGPGVQLEKSVQVAPAVAEEPAGDVARVVQTGSHDCHMDQSDGRTSSDDDEPVQSPEVLVCAAADSTTPDDGAGLWVEDRQPTVVEGIEEEEEEEEEERGGEEESRGGHKGRKGVEKTSSTPTFKGRKWKPRVRPLLAAFTPKSARRTKTEAKRFRKLQRSV